MTASSDVAPLWLADREGLFTHHDTDGHEMPHAGQHAVMLCVRAEEGVGLYTGFERLRARACL